MSLDTKVTEVRNCCPLGSPSVLNAHSAAQGPTRGRSIAHILRNATKILQTAAWLSTPPVALVVKEAGDAPASQRSSSLLTLLRETGGNSHDKRSRGFLPSMSVPRHSTPHCGTSLLFSET